MIEALINSKNKQQQIIESNTVNVYLRLASSKSIKVKLPRKSLVYQLKQIVKNYTAIKEENQILFYQGKELIDGKFIKLKENTIIHIKDAQQNCQDITIHIFKHMPQNRNLFKVSFDFVPINVNPNQSIQLFLANLLVDVEESIDYKRTKVIDCGRFLKINKTFAQQKIHSQTQIHLILRKKLQQTQQQDEKQEKMLIESVLKRSREHSKDVIRNRQFGQIDQVLPERNRNSLQQCKIQQDRLITKQTEMAIDESKFALELPLIGARRSLPSYYNPTKSSELWQSQKLIKKQVTPLKFRLREYGFYEGPKSVRDCNCKKKTEFYQTCQHQKGNQGTQSPTSSSSPKDSRLKGSRILKSRMTIV